MKTPSIEKDVQMPDYGSVYPWSQMEVGDSFFVAPAKPWHFKTTCHRAGVRLGHKFRPRDVYENGKWGVRVWRSE